jgi:hypothetical protein
MEDNAQEGSVDVEPVIVINEAPLPEFIHKEIDTEAGCPNHFRQHLLRHLWKHVGALIFLDYPILSRVSLNMLCLECVGKSQFD